MIAFHPERICLPVSVILEGVWDAPWRSARLTVELLHSNSQNCDRFARLFCPAPECWLSPVGGADATRDGRGDLEGGCCPGCGGCHAAALAGLIVDTDCMKGAQGCCI